jgi:hypothetical protein
MAASEGATPLHLSMNDAMALVRYAVGLEGASEHEARTHEHTAGIRRLARRIQNEATTGAHGTYSAADVALVESLAPSLGAAGDRIVSALRSRVG